MLRSQVEEAEVEEAEAEVEEAEAEVEEAEAEVEEATTRHEATWRLSCISSSLLSSLSTSSTSSSYKETRKPDCECVVLCIPSHTEDCDVIPMVRLSLVSDEDSLQSLS
jgi:hypothetical protein